MNMESDFHPYDNGHGDIRLPPNSNIQAQFLTCANIVMTFNHVKQAPNGKITGIYLQGLLWKYINEVYATYGTSPLHSILSRKRFVDTSIQSVIRLMNEAAAGKPEDGFTMEFYNMYNIHTYPQMQRFLQTFYFTIQSIAENGS